ncbi:MAG: 30S ribosomal protein S16 [Saprospiraceae bacterium]|nr:30S ribosomal protein S16 [Saprospiraceae bacterium]
MPVKIRLARRGRKKRPYYHIVVADSRAPRDGKFIENIGFYNPMTVPASIDLDRDKAYEWISKGAQPTDTARAILKFKGVYFKKHLMRGVAKGALTEEKANEMYEAWIAEKEAKVEARKADTARERENFWKMVSGEIKPPKKVANEEAAEAFRETEEEGEAAEANAEAPAEETAVEAEAPAEEAAPEAEAPAEEATAEAEAPAEEAAPEAEAPAEDTKEEE